MENNYDFNTYNINEGYYEKYSQNMIKSARSTFSRFSLSLFLYVVIAYAVSFVAEFLIIIFLGVEKSSLLFENIYFQWLMGVGPMYLISFPVLFLVTRKMKTAPRIRRKLPFDEFLIFFLISQAVMFAGNVIGTTITDLISAVFKIEITDATSELIESSPIWLIILVAVVIGPIIEELIFRKLMIDRLSRFGDGIAILVSSVAFGLFHGNLHQLFYATFLGFMLGYIYTRTGNCLYTILLHMLINFFGSVAVLPILDSYSVIEELSALFATGKMVAYDFHVFVTNLLTVASYSVIQYALVGAGTVLAILNFKNRVFSDFQKVSEFKLPKEKRANVILLNVGTILFLVISLILTVLSLFL